VAIMEGSVGEDGLAEGDVALEVELVKGKIDSWKTTSCDTIFFFSLRMKTAIPLVMRAITHEYTSF
jgi:hypothetical protein